MAADTETDKTESGRMRDKVGDFLKQNLAQGELALKHALGLGQQPNVIPVTEPLILDFARSVEVGWHPVGGFAGKWFAEETGLGKMITEKVNRYPDPTQHWAVLIGDYAHQLWMDEEFHVIYNNAKIKREEWKTFPVGETRFNDDAIRRSAETVIQNIRDRQPSYNLITNNCQTYVLQLLDAVKVGGKKEFGTTLAVYERLRGPGKVMDLFSQPEAESLGSLDTVSIAQQAMHDNTAQLNTQDEYDRHNQQTQRMAEVLDDELDSDNGDEARGEDSKAKKKKKRDIFERFKKW